MTRIVLAEARRDAWLRRAERARFGWLRRLYGEYAFQAELIRLEGLREVRARAERQ
jgi:hypothetical protein